MRDFLKEAWDLLTFKCVREQPDSTTISITIVGWILAICVIIISVTFLAWTTYTVYRVIAYDYTVETMSAIVIGKHYEPKRTTLRYNAATKTFFPVFESAEYNVHFTTKYKISDVINDADLYGNVVKSLTFSVTLKIGRDRNGIVQYHRVIDYDW